MTLLFCVCCLGGPVIEIANVVIIPIIVIMTLAARCCLLTEKNIYQKNKKDISAFQLFALLQDV